MATRLSALLGLLQGAKATLKKPLDAAYHNFQRPNLFNGFTKTYRPIDEENGEVFPNEGEIVQLNVEEVLATLAPAWARVFDLQATVDATNQTARGELTIGGLTIALPGPTLVWLDKQLTELHTLISKAPEVNPTKLWSVDAASGDWHTSARTSIKTRKVPRSMIVAPEGKFPAQVQTYNEDLTIGYWDTVDHSGAVMPSRKREILGRITELRDGVKIALAQANEAEAVDVKIGATVLNYLLADA